MIVQNHRVMIRCYYQKDVVKRVREKVYYKSILSFMSLFLSIVRHSDYADLEEDLAVRKLENDDDDLIKGNPFIILFTMFVYKKVNSFIVS
jgi:hypothetical protein